MRDSHFEISHIAHGWYMRSHRGVEAVLQLESTGYQQEAGPMPRHSRVMSVLFMPGRVGDLVSIGNGFVYRNGHTTELDSLIAPTPNVRLAGATGINDAGDIVGTAVLTAPDGTETTVGYELVPIA